MQLHETIRNAGGDLAGRNAPIDRESYGFLFRDLRLKSWQPGGKGDAEAIFELSQTLYGESEDNKDIPAGYAFFGQFITHDLTFAVPPFGHPGKRVNQRTPRFDLDSIYAGGPDVHPHLYQLADPKFFVIGQNPSGELDLPRNTDTSLDQGGTGDFDRRRRALIGDPRNDENTIISQLHLAFLLLHNRLAQTRTFEDARRITQWTYQHAMRRIGPRRPRTESEILQGEPRPRLPTGGVLVRRVPDGP